MTNCLMSTITSSSTGLWAHTSGIKLPRFTGKKKAFKAFSTKFESYMTAARMVRAITVDLLGVDVEKMKARQNTLKVIIDRDGATALPTPAQQLEMTNAHAEIVALPRR